MTQDRWFLSWRIWGSVWAVVAGLLSIPGFDAWLVSMVGDLVSPAVAQQVAIVLAAISPLVSKLKDKRAIA